MEKVLNPHDKQSMKVAILKHEETFKEQVYELHRLYQVQKMLMKNMNSNRDYRGNISTGHQRIRGADGMLEIEDENDIELTLGPAKYGRKKKDTTPQNSEAGQSFSSSSTESSFIKKSSNRAQNRSDRREELSAQQWGLVNMHQKFQSSKRSFDIDEPLKQERLDQPPWLFQVLSLNMT